ncbi:MAG: hypothetical protein M1294_12250 [Firmicutes bacterium]|uniref:Cobalt transporter n=1 Tax=Sulfobacillus benefaciens TaxID=453960 RepID=A0A2T2X7U3_9FIRM|nr:hypothetical protein [Bacillota bacterium]MCL5014087.1 hypothetical protein [Bacillota bacterium]PSR30562.1 MAG: hypothetical protein C7B43_05650 [Sulfobacillus benefaciens]
MESSAAPANPLVMLQVLFLGLIIIFITNRVWLFGAEAAALTAVQWRYHIRMTRTEALGLIIGPGLWALLAYVNHRSGDVSGALWDGFRFGGALWLSIIIVHLSAPADMIQQLERTLKKWLGPRTIIGQMSLIALLVMRYIPALRVTAKRVNTDVRMRRHLAGHEGTWKDTLRFLTPLVMISILRSERIAESIWARGWRPNIIPVTAGWSKRDSVITAGVWIVFLLTWKVLI